MFFTFTVDGKNILYQVPDFHTVLATHLDNPQQDKPKDKGKIGSPGEEYSGLIADASIIASVNEVAKNVSDTGARDEIHRGVKAAVQALQRSAGKNVTISE